MKERRRISTGRMHHTEAAAIKNAWEAAWDAAHALDALAHALRILASPEALLHAREADGAARLAREWANELAAETT